MDEWTVGDVSRFLLEIGLEMHVGEFRTGQVDGRDPVIRDCAKKCTSLTEIPQFVPAGPALLALDNPKMMDLGIYDMSARGCAPSASFW